MRLHGTMQLNNSHQLEIGGVNVLDLIEAYGTPLMIFDEVEFISNVKIFQENFTSSSYETHVIYGSKALINLYIAGLIKHLDMYIDVVSEGEFFVAEQAGLDTGKIYFHGNNKSYQELDHAILNGVGKIIVDHMTEFERIEDICSKHQTKQNILIRLNTEFRISKFGFDIRDPDIYKKISRMASSDHVKLMGFHHHVASQDFDIDYFKEYAEKLIVFSKNAEGQTGMQVEELNFGGGYGVYYTENDADKLNDYTIFLKEYLRFIEGKIKDNQLENIQTLSIEPGRAIVNPSGSMVYQVGEVKKQLDGRSDIFINGGLADNPRPLMYGSEYEAGVLNKFHQEPTAYYRLTGQACEQDVIIDHIKLPQVEVDDYVLVPSTGAYTYSMSSNNNKHLRPPIVSVKNGQSRVIVERENYAHLIANDVRYRKGDVL